MPTSPAISNSVAVVVNNKQQCCCLLFCCNHCLKMGGNSIFSLNNSHSFFSSLLPHLMFLIQHSNLSPPNINWARGPSSDMWGSRDSLSPEELPAWCSPVLGGELSPAHISEPSDNLDMCLLGGWSLSNPVELSSVGSGSQKELAPC